MNPTLKIYYVWHAYKYFLHGKILQTFEDVAPIQQHLWRCLAIHKKAEKNINDQTPSNWYSEKFKHVKHEILVFAMESMQHLSNQLLSLIAGFYAYDFSLFDCLWWIAMSCNH